MLPMIRITFRDHKGNVVARCDAPRHDALAEIVRFVDLHGFDPDGLGEGAMAGSIDFKPIQKPIDVEGEGP